MSNIIDEIEPSPQYVKGFNAGYLLGKHEPELFNQLQKSLDKDSDYIHGLKMGKKQLDRELLLQQMKEAPENNRSKGLERG